MKAEKDREERDDGPDLTDEDERLLDLAWQKVAEEERQKKEKG